MRLIRPVAVVVSILGLAACGDDETRETVSDTSASSLTPGSNPSSEPTTTPTSGVDTTAGTTSDEGSATAIVSGTTGTSTGPATVTDPGPTTDPITSTDPSSTGTTMSPATSEPDTSGESSSSGTTVACTCTPGDVMGCDGQGQQSVCQDDCVSFGPEPCPNGQVCQGDACVALFCLPNAKVCEDPDSYKQCNGDGSAYDPPVACMPTEGCFNGDCVSLCVQAEAEPSTVGCSFFAARMDNFNGNETDSLIVGNTSTKPANVQLFFTPSNSNVEAPQGGPVNVGAGQTTTFSLTNAPFDKASGLRAGGAYRVATTVPVVAYQHSPIGAQATNDASLLFPEHALRQDYVISSWPDSHNAYPSYFFVIARDDGTTVEWTPSQNTLAGNGVPAVTAGQTGQVAMNRFGNLQVRAPFGGDLSGTLIHADKPIWVIGAVECVNVPNKNITFCDHIQEQMLALDYWGKKYVGAHSPRRNNEKHYWRVFGGEDGTTVTTTPAQPGTPFMVNKGQFKDLVIANNTSFIFDGDKPFLPVQYLESQDGGAGTGDPAMYQMVPVEQFLSRYAFVTGTGYNVHYAQIIRVTGGPDVLIDGQVVNGYYQIGGYDVADFKINGGAHLAESAGPFGLINVGYTGVTSYAYPGGLRLAIINPQ
jgi:hypothetical protein